MKCPISATKNSFAKFLNACHGNSRIWQPGTPQTFLVSRWIFGYHHSNLPARFRGDRAPWYHDVEECQSRLAGFTGMGASARRFCPQQSSRMPCHSSSSTGALHRQSDFQLATGGTHSNSGWVGIRVQAMPNGLECFSHEHRCAFTGGNGRNSRWQSPDECRGSSAR